MPTTGNIVHDSQRAYIPTVDFQYAELLNQTVANLQAVPTYPTVLAVNVPRVLLHRRVWALLANTSIVGAQVTTQRFSIRGMLAGVEQFRIQMSTYSFDGANSSGYMRCGFPTSNGTATWITNQAAYFLNHVTGTTFDYAFVPLLLDCIVDSFELIADSIANPNPTFFAFLIVESQAGI